MPRFQNLSWPFYAVFTAICFTIFFVSNKIASTEVTPFLYVLITHFVNMLGHLYFVKRRKIKAKTALISLPASSLWLIALVGLAAATNELSSVFMFKVGAPLSISMPIFTASTVFLIALFGLLILKEKINFKQIAGLCSIIIGIILLNV